MKTQILLLVPVIVAMSACNLQAAIDWDFYDDGIIQEGDEYANVRLFDTLPDHTTVDMTGGSAYNILTYDFSTLNVSGGQTEVFAYNQSTINVSGGTVYTLDALDFSNVNVFGGSVRGLHAYDTGIVNVSDSADVFSLVASEYGVVNVSGGSVDHLAALEFGTFNLSGGAGFDYLVAENSGLINIFGYDLSKTDIGGGYGYGFVSGEWEDGTIFTIDFSVAGAYSRVVLYEIPEPSTLVIIMTGLLFFRKRQR